MVALLAPLASPAIAGCGASAPADAPSCVDEVGALLAERSEVIPAMVADIHERYADDLESPEATAALSELTVKMDSLENRIGVALAKCPEAKSMEIEMRREIPVRVQKND